MKTKIFFLLAAAVALFSFDCFAQQNKRQTAPQSLPNNQSNTASQAIKSSPAYAEILLRKTELESLLEDYSVGYTEDYPKVKEARYELSLIERDITKLLSLKESDAPKLTLALGKLMVRRAQLETDLWALQTKFGDQHPDVARAKRRAAAFEKAIGEILQ